MIGAPPLDAIDMNPPKGKNRSIVSIIMNLVVLTVNVNPPEGRNLSFNPIIMDLAVLTLEIDIIIYHLDITTGHTMIKDGLAPVLAQLQAQLGQPLAVQSPILNIANARSMVVLETKTKSMAILKILSTGIIKDLKTMMLTTMIGQNLNPVRTTYITNL